ncbi:MAG: hypothetical protein ACT4P5_05855 [Armatimonadota bacterium]
MLLLSMLIMALTVAIVLLGVMSATDGFKRWGWRGRRGFRNWWNLGGVLLGIYIIVNVSAITPVGSVLFGAVLGAALALLGRPLILRENERINRQG